MSSHKKLKKIGVLGCGCALVCVVVTGILVTGAVKGVVGWVSGAASSLGVSIPKDIKLPTEIRLPKEVGLPPIQLPTLPVNPFKLTGQEQIVLGREVAAKQNLGQEAYVDKNVSDIAARLVKALPANYTGPKDLGGWEWKFSGMRTAKGDINAVALPGGKVYVYDGLVKMTNGNKDELAAVIGHEMAHVVEEHTAEQLRNAGLLKKATALLLQNSGIQGGGSQEEMLGVLAAQMGEQITQMRLSQSAEYQADKIGFQLMASAGYDPKAGLNVLRKLDKLSGGKDTVLSGVFSTHPPTKKRIQNLQKSMGSFKAGPTVTGG
ncbi:MAG: M48 family metallopeptidase [Armatimonadota bacterium]